MELIKDTPIEIPEKVKGYYNGSWENVIVYDLAGNPEPTYYVFEDAGCC